jgi:uncharacterized protein YcaQ
MIRRFGDWWGWRRKQENICFLLEDEKECIIIRHV